ncbi:MAG: hypothetical protein IPP58_13710 [Holophagaceae bacterium]|uniref:Cytochrome C biogenesis protein transmembrane domain-containing protein n=1 Tax=Candidatus Geothrix skivensis TaxID=2954439 RepID=A0A9D7XJB1_9BACT|nr:hypothetical protein [Candidatus Geothrix skivensis]
MLGLGGLHPPLGLVAALTGSLMGDVGWGWKALLGLILLAVGLHLLGLFALPTPSHSHMARFHGAGLLGAFALGGLTGTLSAPCATPALAAVLTIVALQKQVLWGGVLLFTYALGHVLLLFWPAPRQAGPAGMPKATSPVPGALAAQGHGPAPERLRPLGAVPRVEDAIPRLRRRESTTTQAAGHADPG